MTTSPSPQPTSWVGAPDLALSVACGGEDHVVKIIGAELQLENHPNLDAELALVAFGGEEPRCVALHHLWVEAIADGGFLGEWVDETRMSPAWFSWLAMALDRMRAEGFHEFLRRLPPARAQRMGEFLHHMPPPWIDRAAAAVSEAVFEGGGVACTFAESSLTVATSNRLRRAFVDAVGGRQLAVGAAALVPLTMSTSPTETLSAAGVLRGPARGVALTVGNTWLHRVWAVGAAVIDGHLVLALHGLGGGPPSTEAESLPPTTRTATASVLAWKPAARGGHQPVIETRRVAYGARRWGTA